MTRWADQPLPRRQLADKLYEPRPGTGRLWVGPCGHPASSMWIREDLLIECAAEGSSTHTPTPAHFLGVCVPPACTVIRCGTLYRPDALEADDREGS